MHDWELEVQILSSLIFEALVLLRPLCAFQVETVNETTLGFRVECSLYTAVISSNDLFLWSELGLYHIE